MTTITQITHGHPAYDVVTEFLEHEVGRVHGRFIPVADEQAYVVEPTTGHPYLKVEVFVQGLPIVEDEIPTRTTYSFATRSPRSGTVNRHLAKPLTTTTTNHREDDPRPDRNGYLK